MPSSKLTISVVVPLFNEAASIPQLHEKIIQALEQVPDLDYELVYVDDGSADSTLQLISDLSEQNARIKVLRLSRNFGKESALTAGLAVTTGDAVITLDGDGQHPPELIKSFVEIWQKGTRIVIGVRTKTEDASSFKRLTSKFFYSAFNFIASQKLVPGSTDYRLLDREVVDEFLKLEESNRITRGLIDWLGFDKKYIYFVAKVRLGGKESYSTKKLLQLGMDSFVALSPAPLYLFGYLGVLITSLSFVLGTAIVIEQLILDDPLGWKFTGTAMLGILIIFLVGLVLISEGVLSLYISHMHNQVKRRPLYVVDQKKSRLHKN